jgi:hypothetical protein
MMKYLFLLLGFCGGRTDYVNNGHVFGAGPSNCVYEGQFTDTEGGDDCTDAFDACVAVGCIT